MAVVIPAQGSGDSQPSIATDLVGSDHFQKVKLDLGGAGASSGLVFGQALMAASVPVVLASDQSVVPVNDNGGTLSVDDGGGNLSIDDGGNSITVDGSVSVSGSVAVTDNSGSLTVDAPVGTPVFVRLSDGSSAISTLPVSLASVPSHAVTNAGTFAVQVDGNALTALQLIDDIVYTDDTSTHSTGSSKGALMMAAATPTDGSVNANDIGAVAMTVDRKLHVAVMDALPAGTAAIGKLAANSGVDIGDVDVTSVPTDPFGANADAASATGSISAKLRGIATALGVTALDLGSGTGGSRTLRSFRDTAQWTGGNGASGSGVQRVTIANDSTGVLATVSTVTTLTGGGIAHDGADSGNPVKVGAKAIAALSGATLVAAADRADNQADLDGALLVRADGALGDLVNGNASNTDGANTQVIAAAGAGVKVYITDITITNTSANNIYVELKDGTTAKWTFPVPANGGVTHHFRSPLGGTANTAWNFDPSAATTTVYCSAAGFKSKI